MTKRSFLIDGPIPVAAIQEVKFEAPSANETILVSLLDTYGVILAETTLVVHIGADGAYTDARRSIVVAKMTGKGVRLSCYRPSNGDVYEMAANREYHATRGQNIQFTWPPDGRVVKWSVAP